MKCLKNTPNATLLLLVFALLLTPAAGQIQNKQKLLITDKTTIPQSGTDDVAVLTIAYGKLSRYINAAQKSNASTPGSNSASSAETERIRFEISNVRTGAIEESYPKMYGDLVTKPQGEVIEIVTGGRANNGGLEFAAYEAKWADNPESTSLVEDWEHTSVEEVLKRLATSVPPVKKYTSYEVKVRLGKKERRYRAMILHHDVSAPANQRLSFLDNIVGQTALTKAFYETRPIVE